MTIFQAYCSSSEDPATWRFVLTFPDSSVADEWWRGLSELPSVASTLTRVNPQFYTNTSSVFNIYNFFSDARTRDFASNFLGRFFLTMIDDRSGRDIPILPGLNIANAISGNCFFIRCTADSTLYWYYDQSNTAKHNLTVSATGRTRFRIAAVDPDTAGKVLIGTDLVTLQLEYTTFLVNENNAKDLFVHSEAHTFLFSDLLKNIGFNQFYGYLKDESGDGSSTNGSGWLWELVV